MHNLIAQKHITDSMTKNVHNRRGCCKFNFYHEDIIREECAQGQNYSYQIMTTYTYIKPIYTGEKNHLIPLPSFMITESKCCVKILLVIFPTDEMHLVSIGKLYRNLYIQRNGKCMQCSN